MCISLLHQQSPLHPGQGGTGGSLRTKVTCTWDRLGQIQHQSTLHPGQGGQGFYQQKSFAHRTGWYRSFMHPLHPEQVGTDSLYTKVTCSQDKVVQVYYAPKSIAPRTGWYRSFMHQSPCYQGQGDTGALLCTIVLYNSLHPGQGVGDIVEYNRGQSAFCST